MKTTLFIFSLFFISLALTLTVKEDAKTHLLSGRIGGQRVNHKYDNYEDHTTEYLNQGNIMNKNNHELFSRSNKKFTSSRSSSSDFRHDKKTNHLSNRNHNLKQQQVHDEYSREEKHEINTENYPNNNNDMNQNQENDEYDNNEFNNENDQNDQNNQNYNTQNNPNTYQHKVKKIKQHRQNDLDQPNNGNRYYYVNQNRPQDYTSSDTSSFSYKDYVDYNKVMTNQQLEKKKSSIVTPGTTDQYQGGTSIAKRYDATVNPYGHDQARQHIKSQKQHKPYDQNGLNDLSDVNSLNNGQGNQVNQPDHNQDINHKIQNENTLNKQNPNTQFDQNNEQQTDNAQGTQNGQLYHKEGYDMNNQGQTSNGQNDEDDTNDNDQMDNFEDRENFNNQPGNSGYDNQYNTMGQHHKHKLRSDKH